MVKIATTSDIEKAIMQRCKTELRMSPIAPSLVLPHGWEADVAAATKTGLIHEFEIKVSRSDFLADFKKNEYHPNISKHERMARRLHGKELDCPDNDFRKSRGWVPLRAWTPNYFWFCSPIGILKADDIPNHTGWLEFEFRYVTPPYRNSRPYWEIVCHERKKAPRLHKEKVFNERMKDMFLSRLTNIVTLGRGGNYDAIPTKIDTTEIDASTTQMKLF